jgi:hypothetical protein
MFWVPLMPVKPKTAASEAPKPRSDEKDDDPPPPRPKGRAGRPATVLAPQAIERLRKAGGQASGSIRTMGKLLGTKSKTATRRLLHRLASDGQITLASGPEGTSVALA